MTAAEQLARAAALAEPTRRALYEHVAASGREVGRDEAALSIGVSRKLAAFHLERLLEVGLLEATFRRLSGRSGPGAGRPAKLYRRAQVETAVSVPPRRYDLLARVLATANPEADAIREAAREVGHSLGSGGRGRAGLLRALARNGYEPYRDGPSIRLRNCPFEALAKEHRSLVCGLNLALLSGLADVTRGGSVTPVLELRPGSCCVAFTPA